MAVYHLSVKSSARASAGAHAEYIQREGQYADRDDLAATESGNMPRWAAHDPNEFWAAADAFERANGRAYTELEIALPRELDRAQQVELVREFVENTIGTRHAYTWALHVPQASDRGEQPHVHLMFSERRDDGIERNPEQYFRRWNRVNPEQGGAGKDPWFSSTKFIWSIREEWSRTANEHLQQAGLEVRIDHRSNRELGIELEPSRKVGPGLHIRNEQHREVFAELTRENRERAARNGARLAAEPELAIRALTATQSFFSRQDLLRLISRNSDSAEQFSALQAKLFASPELVALARGKDAPEWFTSRSLHDAERQLVATAGRLAEQKSHVVEAGIRTDISSARSFNAGQQAAFETLTGEAGLAVVNGAAGTGKSYVLGAVREAYERAGYTVIGAALQGKTSDDLERDSGIRSSTVHRLLARLEAGESRLDSRSLLVIDEAGLVGSLQLSQLLRHAERAGAGVRLVGDAYQLHAVAAGDAFRAVGDKVAEAGSRASLTEIVRQRSEWQRQASQQLSLHQIAEGLDAYRSRGFVAEFGTQEQARAGLLKQWDADRKSSPEASQILIAHTNRERQQLNDAVRELRQSGGELGEETTIQSVRGRLPVAVRDRLIFLQNDDRLGVRNGALGTVAGHKAGRLMVQLDSGLKVEVDPKLYPAIDHGYATTVHKSQGVTVDRAYVMATDTLNAQLTYVSLTRHRDAVYLAYSTENFRDYADLTQRLSRVGRKAFAADFSLRAFDRQEEGARRESIADRRERQLAPEQGAKPALPVQETALDKDLARLWSTNMADLSAHVRQLRARPEMLAADQYPPVREARAARTQLEFRIESAEAELKRLAAERAEFAQDNQFKAALHSMYAWRNSALADLEKEVWTLERQRKADAKALEQARATEQGVLSQAQKDYTAQAPARAETQKMLGMAEQVLRTRSGHEVARQGLDETVMARALQRPGLRDGDPLWQKLGQDERRLIDQRAERLTDAQKAEGAAREVARERAGPKRESSRGMDFER